MASSAEKDSIKRFSASNGLQLLGLVPYDEQILKADMAGESPLRHAETSRCIAGIREIGKTLLERENIDK